MTKEKTKVKGWDTIDALRKGKTIVARYYTGDWTYCMRDGHLHKLAKNGTWQYAPGAHLNDLLSTEFEIIPAIPDPKFDLNFMDAYRLMKSGRKVANEINDYSIYFLENGRVKGLSDHFSLAEIECKWRVVE